MDTFVNQGMWVTSGLLLFFVALVRFNRPPTNRTSTTFLLFYAGVFFYYALLIALWLFVIMSLYGGGYGLDRISSALGRSLNATESLNSALPVIGLLFIAVASQFKLVGKMDASARQLCIQLAAIPAEAEQLAVEISHGQLQITDPDLKSRISHEISENICQNAIRFKNDGTLASRFTRVVSLYWLFIVPDNAGESLSFPTSLSDRSAYTRIMRLNGRGVERAIELYNSLMENGIAYFTSQTKSRQIEEMIKKEIQELTLVICRLIARFVLYQGVTDNQRRRRLSIMGLNPRDHQPAFGRDQWVATILAIAILFLFMSILVPSRQPFSETFMYSMMMAIQLGMAIVAGTVVAQRFIRRHEGAVHQFPPLAELMVAALVVIGLCMILRIGWPLVPSLLNTGSFSFSESLGQFSKRWPFLLLPFICTFSIGALCSYVGVLSWRWTRIAVVGGVLNAIAFALGGWLIVALLDADFLRQNIREDTGAARTFIISTVAITGFVLGAIVLAIFPKVRSAQSKNIFDFDQALRNQIDIREIAEEPAEAAFETNRPRVRGATKDLGGYNRDAVEQLEGRYVCFRPIFSNPDVISAYQILIYWDEARASLVFEEKNRPDSSHTQKGQVYIPDGRPFMSLVTVDRGALRLVMVARPDHAGVARGLIMTLANSKGVHFTPACAPIILRRLVDDANPQLGFVHRGALDYRSYVRELNEVSPDFGIFANIAKTFSGVPTSGIEGQGQEKRGANGQ